MLSTKTSKLVSWEKETVRRSQPITTALKMAVVSRRFGTPTWAAVPESVVDQGAHGCSFRDPIR